MVTCSNILSWRIPWTEESGGLQSIGLQRVGHDWSDSTRMHMSGLNFHSWSLFFFLPETLITFYQIIPFICSLPLECGLLVGKNLFSFSLLLGISTWKSSFLKKFLLSTVLSLSCCTQLFSSLGERSYSPAWVLEHGLSSCDAQAYLLHSTWNLLRPGIEPMSPALAGGLPPGKTNNFILKTSLGCSLSTL